MTATPSTTPAHPAPTSPTPPHPIVSPESDGKPMTDNTRQFRYIVTIQGGIAALFADRPDVLDRLIVSGMTEDQTQRLLGLA